MTTWSAGRRPLEAPGRDHPPRGARGARARRATWPARCPSRLSRQPPLRPVTTRTPVGARPAPKGREHPADAADGHGAHLCGLGGVQPCVGVAENCRVSHARTVRRPLRAPGWGRNQARPDLRRAGLTVGVERCHHEGRRPVEVSEELAGRRDARTPVFQVPPHCPDHGATSSWQALLQAIGSQAASGAKSHAVTSPSSVREL